MRKSLFLLIALPYFAYTQADENPIVFATEEWQHPTSMSMEKSYMGDERWIVFYEPGLGRVMLSNYGYVATSDSIGNNVTELIHCDAYPIMAAVIGQIFEKEYYWYSQQHFKEKQKLQYDETVAGGNSTFFATIDGREFTYTGSPEYVLSSYMKRFPDAVLVAILPRSKGDIRTHK